MSWAELNGVRATKGTLTLPYEGVFVGDVTLATTDVLPPKALFTIGDLTVNVTVVPTRTTSFGGERSARIVGGGNGWGTKIGPMPYRQPGGVPLSTVLSDAAMAVGELVSPLGLAAARGRILGDAAVREAGPPGRTVLRMWCEPLWWLDATGALQLSARETTPFSGMPTDLVHLGPIASAFTSEVRFAGREIYRIATEAPSDWVPGRTFSSNFIDGVKTVSAATHVFRDDGYHRVDVMVTE